MARNIVSIKTGIVGKNVGFSGRHRTSYTQKNLNVYPHQRRITFHTWLWDTLYENIHSNDYFLQSLTRKRHSLACWNIYHLFKGQLISKANCQAEDSSKKRTNEFVFTTMRHVFVHFLEEIEDTKNTFQNYLTFNNS